MAPFTTREFFGVFAAYNVAVWPAQVVLLLAAVAAVGAITLRRRWSGPAAGLLLGGLWVWVGAVYHLGFFTAINPAAYAFGVLFIAQGGLLVWSAVRGRLRFGPGEEVGRAARIASWSMIAYSLALYPLIGALAGHTYPAAPTFGAPCPTTIFTFGLLLRARRPVPMRLLVIPGAWSLVGASAVRSFGVIEDAALPLAAAAAVILIAAAGRPRQRRPAGAVAAGRG